MKKNALIISCEDYHDSAAFQTLYKTSSDAEKLKKILELPGAANFDEVAKCNNENSKQVKLKISTFLSGCEENDLNLIYFRGYSVFDDSGVYLVFYDSNLRELPDTAINIKSLIDMLDSSLCKKQIIILDCFHNEKSSFVETKEIFNAHEKKRTNCKDRFIITPTGSRTIIKEGSTPNKENSYFMEAIYEVLKRKSFERAREPHLTVKAFSDKLINIMGNNENIEYRPEMIYGRGDNLEMKLIHFWGIELPNEDKFRLAEGSDGDKMAAMDELATLYKDKRKSKLEFEKILDFIKNNGDSKKVRKRAEKVEAGLNNEGGKSKPLNSIYLIIKLVLIFSAAAAAVVVVVVLISYFFFSDCMQKKIESRFIKRDCKSIYDSDTQMEWLIGEDKDYTLREARIWASKQVACGAGWRLPSENEVLMIYGTGEGVGTGHLKGGKPHKPKLDPIFSAIGGGSWIWLVDQPKGNMGSAFNFYIGKKVKIHKIEMKERDEHFNVRVFAIRRAD